MAKPPKQTLPVTPKVDSRSDKLLQEFQNWMEEAQKRSTILDVEIKGLPDNVWAGSYYMGDGLGDNETLKVAPKAGFCWTDAADGGGRDYAYGQVQTDSGTLLSLNRTDKPLVKFFLVFKRNFIIVPWASRRYLIPPDEMVQFCNDVNSGSEPRSDIHGLHFLRDGDETHRVTGLPTIPVAFRKYLLAKPVVTQIVNVQSRHRQRTGWGEGSLESNVIVDVGSADGILPEMEFAVIAPDCYMTETHVTRVMGPHRSAVRIIQDISVDNHKPQAHWRLSTKDPRWNNAKIDNHQQRVSFNN